MVTASNPHQIGTEINLVPLARKGKAILCLLATSCPYYSSAFQYLIIDLVGNIVVFIPLGFGLAGIFHPKRIPVTLILGLIGGFIFSLTIELIQLAIPSRTTDIDDLIFNSLGGLIGASLFVLYKKFKPIESYQ